MSQSEGEAVLVCIRVSDARVVIPGSTKDACRDCGLPIWVSRASRLLAAEKKAPFSCMACANLRAEKGRDVSIEPITEDQWKEFRDAVERG